MKILISGATGVLGRSTVRELLSAGHCIRALDRSGASTNTIRALGIEAVAGSLFDVESLTRAAAGCEAVLHLATRIPLSNKMGKQEAWIENDRIRRDGACNLVDAALACGAGTFVYPSVSFVYADSGEEWIDVATTPVASASVLESTLSAEAEVQRFNQAGGQGISLRMGAFYGPQSRQTREQIDLAKRGIAAMFGRPGAYHPTIWIDDAAKAVACALNGPAGIYDIVDDEPLTNQEAIGAMASAVGKKKLWRLPEFVLEWTVGKEMSALLGRSQRVLNRRFKDATGWNPNVDNLRTGWAIIAKDHVG